MHCEYFTTERKKDSRFLILHLIRMLQAEQMILTKSGTIYLHAKSIINSFKYVANQNLCVRNISFSITNLRLWNSL